MVGNWPPSKDDLYGPPPAYSIANNYEHPPPPSYSPSVYVLPVAGLNYQERRSSHASVLLPGSFTRYLLGAGLLHMAIGLGTIVCDIILTIMNESFSFTGLWTGALSIILGIYLILFVSHPEKRICSLERLQFLYLGMGLVATVALVLASINLASDSCYKIFFGPDRCEHVAYVLKIVLVTSFAVTLAQICLTLFLIVINGRQLRSVSRRNEGTLSDMNDWRDVFKSVLSPGYQSSGEPRQKERNEQPFLSSKSPGTCDKCDARNRRETIQLTLFFSSACLFVSFSLSLPIFSINEAEYVITFKMNIVAMKNDTISLAEHVQDTHHWAFSGVRNGCVHWLDREWLIAVDRVRSSARHSPAENRFNSDADTLHWLRLNKHNKLIWLVH